MCVGTPAQQIMGNKTVSNISNNTPTGFIYKQLSGGQKFSDAVKDGNIYAGYVG